MDFVIKNNRLINLIWQEFFDEAIAINSSSMLELLNYIEKKEGNGRLLSKKLIFIVIHLKLLKAINEIFDINTCKIEFSFSIYKIFDHSVVGQRANEVKYKTQLKLPTVVFTKSGFAKFISIILLCTTAMAIFFYYYKIFFIVFFTFFSPIVFLAVGIFVWFLLKKYFPQIFGGETFSGIYSYQDFLVKTFNLNKFFYFKEKDKLIKDLYEIKDIDIDDLEIKNEIKKLKLLFIENERLLWEEDWP